MFVSAVIVLAAFASCKKDHTCDCTITGGGQTQTQTIPMPNTTSKDAKSLCKQAEVTYTGPGSSASCKLK